MGVVVGVAMLIVGTLARSQSACQVIERLDARLFVPEACRSDPRLESSIDLANPAFPRACRAFRSGRYSIGSFDRSSTVARRTFDRRAERLRARDDGFAVIGRQDGTGPSSASY